MNCNADLIYCTWECTTCELNENHNLDCIAQRILIDILCKIVLKGNTHKNIKNSIDTSFYSSLILIKKYIYI
jgi:hypothetical protein